MKKSHIYGQFGHVDAFDVIFLIVSECIAEYKNYYKYMPISWHDSTASFYRLIESYRKNGAQSLSFLQRFGSFDVIIWVLDLTNNVSH